MSFGKWCCELWNARKVDQCFYCERAMLPPTRGKLAGLPLTATVDHRRPLSRSGVKGLENIVLACRDCNELKGDLTEREFFDAVMWMDELEMCAVRTRGGHCKPLRALKPVRDKFGLSPHIY